MAAKLIVAVVVISLDGRILDGAVHALDLAVGPWVVRLGETVLDPVGLADHVEPHRSGIDGVPVSRLLRELDAVVCQDRVDLVRHGFQKEFKEFPGCLAVRLFNQLRDGELAGSVNGDKEMEFAFFCSDLGNVDVEIANRVSLELLPFGLVPIHIG